MEKKRNKRRQENGRKTHEIKQGEGDIAREKTVEERMRQKCERQGKDRK